MKMNEERWFKNFIRAYNAKNFSTPEEKLENMNTVIASASRYCNNGDCCVKDFLHLLAYDDYDADTIELIKLLDAVYKRGFKDGRAY